MSGKKKKSRGKKKKPPNVKTKKSPKRGKKKSPKSQNKKIVIKARENDPKIPKTMETEFFTPTEHANICQVITRACNHPKSIFFIWETFFFSPFGRLFWFRGLFFFPLLGDFFFFPPTDAKISPRTKMR